MRKIVYVLLAILIISIIFYSNFKDDDSIIEQTKITKPKDNVEVIDIKGSDEHESITKSHENNIRKPDIIDSNNINNNQNNLESNIVSESVELNNGITQEKPTYQEEKTKELTAWEELGISEYDYYNKPMWSWATVDFSIEEYSTFNNTRQACIEYGNSLEDIISFSCYTINSYSGAYLGEMLKVVK